MQGQTGRPNRRDQILDVATALFSQHGVQNVTTRHIAAEVGISQPSLYAHFASVQEIQHQVSARAFALLEHSTAPQPGVAPLDQLRAAIAAYFAFGLAHPQAYRIAFMLEHPKSPDHVAGAAQDFLATNHPGPRAYRQFLHLVGQVRPDLPPQELHLETQSLWAGLHGLVALLLARPHFPWADHARLIAHHTDRALRGLSTADH